MRACACAKRLQDQPRCGYWVLGELGAIGYWGFFYSAPQDFVVWGVFCFCARFSSSGG